MAKRERVVRMSVELPLWRALTGYRVLTMIYAVLLAIFGKDNFGQQRFERPWVAVAYLAFLFVWTLATLPKVRSAASCTKRFLVADLVVALTGILLTPLADFDSQSFDGPTLPSIWTAGFGPRLRDQGRLAVGGLRLHLRRRRQHHPARRAQPGHLPQRPAGLGRLHRHRVRRRGRPRQ